MKMGFMKREKENGEGEEKNKTKERKGKKLHLIKIILISTCEKY